MGYSWREHTSELELRIEAGSEREVFADALRAIGELAEQEREPVRAAGATLAREVSVAAADRAALLAAWLGELAYLAECEDLVPQELERLQLGEAALSATIRARRGRPRHLIKGVTYHRLRFERVPGGFCATVVLDV
jgi:SHS2 domain-containing protein